MWTASGYKITLPTDNRTMFGGRVTHPKEDYFMLTDLAKKQIAAENRESELTAEIARLKKENEEANKQKGVKFIERLKLTQKLQKFLRVR